MHDVQQRAGAKLACTMACAHSAPCPQPQGWRRELKTRGGACAASEQPAELHSNSRCLRAVMVDLQCTADAGPPKHTQQLHGQWSLTNGSSFEGTCILIACFDSFAQPELIKCKFDCLQRPPHLRTRASS